MKKIFALALAAVMTAGMTTVAFAADKDNVLIGECGDIGNKAFSGCSSLTNITLNCGNIGSNVFNKCSSITEMTIEKCDDIADKAFLGMTGLKTVTIGKCGSIGSSAFGSMMSSTGAEPCSSLEEVTLN